MQFLHLTEDAKGVSHFADVEIEMAAADFAPPAQPMPISSTEPCRGLLFLVLPVGWGGPRHPTPKRQIAFCLAGRLRVEAGGGECREIAQGGIWRMEDVNGTGHTTTVLGDEPVQLAIVQLE